MAKNYANIYNSTNDSISLEQRFYIKEEVTRGTMVYPATTDFFFTLPGGAINFEAPFESSMQRSGRHHSTSIEQKNSTAWNFSTYFNIDTSVAAGVTEIDPAMRVLWKSLLGNEDTTTGIVYDASEDPDITFTLMEVGDKWSRQTVGAFVNSNNLQLPGDGQATCEWAGNSGESYLIGIGKSEAANTGNDIVVGSGESWRFEVGGAVMVVKDDGTTRSTDTPDGSPRLITAINNGTDTITLGGAALTDVDGSTNPIYLVYYEPDDASISAINDIQTGLVGSISLTGLGTTCFRSLGLNIQNNHELVDYCYGTKNLSGKYFVPGDRLTVELSLSFNLSDEMVEFLHKVKEFQGQVIQAILGDATTRHLQIDIPKGIFNYPGFSLPDTGSIPVEFSGTAFESAFQAEDEITVSFK